MIQQVEAPYYRVKSIYECIEPVLICLALLTHLRRRGNPDPSPRCYCPANIMDGTGRSGSAGSLVCFTTSTRDQGKPDRNLKPDWTWNASPD